MLSPAFAICSCRGCDNPSSTTTKGTCERKTKQDNHMQTSTIISSPSSSSSLPQSQPAQLPQEQPQRQRSRSPSPSSSSSPSSLSPAPARSQSQPQPQQQQQQQQQQQFNNNNNNNNKNEKKNNNEKNSNINPNPQKNLGSYIFSNPFFSKGLGQKSYSHNDLQTAFAIQMHEHDLDKRHSSQLSSSSSYDSLHSLQYCPLQLAQFYEHYFHNEKPSDTKLAQYRAYYSSLFYHDDPHNHNYNHNHDHRQADNNKGYFDAISSWFPLPSKK